MILIWPNKWGEIDQLLLLLRRLPSVKNELYSDFCDVQKGSNSGTIITKYLNPCKNRTLSSRDQGNKEEITSSLREERERESERERREKDMNEKGEGLNPGGGARESCASEDGGEGIIMKDGATPEQSGDSSNNVNVKAAEVDQVSNYSELFDKLRGNTTESFLMIEQEVAQLVRAKLESSKKRHSGGDSSEEDKDEIQRLEDLNKHLKLLKQRLHADVETTETIVRGGEKVWQAVSLNQSFQASVNNSQIGNGNYDSDSASKISNGRRKEKLAESLSATGSANIIKRGVKQHEKEEKQTKMARDWLEAGTDENSLIEEELLDEDFEPPLYEPGSSSPSGMSGGGTRSHRVRDSEARRILQDLQDELRWVDENAMRSRVDCERRLTSMLRGLEARIVHLEGEVEHHASLAEKGVSISSELNQRLVYLESIAEKVESQGSIVQGLARKVEHSVQQIENQASMIDSNSSKGSFNGSPGSGRDLSDAAVAAGRGNHQLQVVNSIVTSAAVSLEESMRAKMKQAVHAMDTSRKGETSRLESRLRGVVDRVDFLETKIAEDHETSVQVLELLLKDNIKRRQR